MSETAVNETPELQPGVSDVQESVVQAESIVAEAAEAQDAVSKRQSVGQKLAAEREAREWTVGYVASQLNLAARQIQALESDNYAALPGLVSVRGFVRSYAKLLKIDANPLVASIVDQQPAPEPQIEPKPGLSTMPFSDNLLVGGGRNSSRMMILAGVLVFVALIVVAVEWKGGWTAVSQSQSAHVSDVTPTPVSETAPEASSASAASDASSETSSALPVTDIAVPASSSATGAVSDATSAPQAKPAAESKPASPQMATSSGADKGNGNGTGTMTGTSKGTADTVVAAPSFTAAPGSKNVLAFKASEDTWVEVKAGSTVLFSHLIKAGSTESVDVSQAAVLTIGNAAGVNVTLRGNPLDVKTDAKSNVAHLNVK